MSTEKEDIRFINCECGEWERFPADMARDKSQAFTHVENKDDNEADYKCYCGNIITSNCESVDIEA